MISVNARSTQGRDLTGVQRYTLEIVDRLPKINVLYPPNGFENGAKGQLWDQLVLPFEVEGLLWSPANLGPVLYGPQVLTVHDISPIDHPEWFTPKYVAMTRVLLPSLLKRVRHVLTVSEFSRRRIIESFDLPVSKVTAIPLAADEKFKPLDHKSQQEECLKNGWPERYILSVGSLEPRKNLKSLFLAWQSWIDRPKDLKLLVAGGQGKVFSGIGFEQVPDDVILLGRVHDSVLPALYACASAFVYPSLYEGFGLPPLEAMSCATPVITSNVASLPEVVGNSAIMVDPHNALHILAAMRQVIEDSQMANNMSLSGLERSRLFKWNTTAELTWQVLENESARV